MQWSSVTERYRGSVLQLICLYGHYDPFRPYRSPLDDEATGTGFIVDIDRGVVATNAHVVANALSITGYSARLPHRELRLSLLSICREKDIALCLLHPKDRDRLTEGLSDRTYLNVKIGDSLLLQETEEVAAMGHPLGKRNIVITTGIVSGFSANVPLDQDVYSLLAPEETPSYIQIAASINIGNSGGPLFNRRGEVIAITAAGYPSGENVGYAIASRTLLSIYSAMVTPLLVGSPLPQVVHPAFPAFSYHSAHPDLIKALFSRHTAPGIYIKEVFPDSVFPQLQEGDVVDALSYYDVQRGLQQRLSRDLTRGYPDLPGEIVTYPLDNYGDSTLTMLCNGSRFSRRLTLKEIFDMVPQGAELSLSIHRQGEGPLLIVSRYEYIPSHRRLWLYPLLQPFPYLVMAGLCLGQLTMNHINAMGGDAKHSKGKGRYRQALIVNQVFPGTSASCSETLSPRAHVTHINEERVLTLLDVVSVLTPLPPVIKIATREGDLFAISRKRMIKEDLRIIKQFEISGYVYPFQ